MNSIQIMSDVLVRGARPLSEIVTVDRTVRPVCLPWIKGFPYPELGCCGPSTYDLGKDIQGITPDVYAPHLFGGSFLASETRGEIVTGGDVYSFLSRTDSLRTCLGLHDAIAIWRRGIDAFAWAFGGCDAFFFGTCASGKSRDTLYIPVVYISMGKLVLDKFDLDCPWDIDDSLILRFTNNVM